MTHPTEPNIRERLAREVRKISAERWRYDPTDASLSAVDAILAELPLILTMEFLAGVRGRFVTETAPDEALISSIIKATVAHIRDGGK